MGETTDSNIGIIILAAGESSRLGEPKQLLKFQDETLISRAVKTALSVAGGNVVLVLGANGDAIKEEVANLQVEIAFNENWKSGMGSSIKAGLEKLLEKHRNISAAVLMLCDQPFITEKTILELIQKQKEAGKKIVACEYKATKGVPAIFSHELFAELLNLSGEAGAKSLIRKHAEDVLTISAPQAEFDIDTPDDHQRLKISEN